MATHRTFGHWVLSLAAALTLACAAVHGEADPAQPAAREPAPAVRPVYGEEVRLQGYFIDRYEYPNRAGALPLVDVTWTEAQALCAARGKRLCTELEWENACGGPRNLAYGYGRHFENGRCNTPRQVGDAWERGPGLKPSGSYPQCGNENGAIDLIGNVWEWTDSWYDKTRGWRVVRGGSWFNSANLAQTSRRYGRYLTPTYRLDLIGFRCCRSAAAPGDTTRATPARGEPGD